MRDTLDFADDFAKAIGNCRELYRAYDEWLTELKNRPMWSPQTVDGWPPQRVDGRRIPWKLFRRAADQMRGFDSPFDSPGLYLWGAEEINPRKIGMTTKTLRKRISGRYVPSLRGGDPKTLCQCLLAVHYEKELREKGQEDFTAEDRARHKQTTEASRRNGAEDWAFHGTERIWVTILPMSGSEEYLRGMEGLLQDAARSWNKDHGHRPLVND